MYVWHSVLMEKALVEAFFVITNLRVDLRLKLYYKDYLDSESWPPIHNTSSTSTAAPPPDPNTLPNSVNVSQIVLNLLSQLLLPLIPASFMYTVRTILSE